MYFVQNIKYLREKLKLRQKDIIGILGLKTESAYSKKENGTVPFSVEELVELADCFGVTLDQLVKQDLGNDMC